MRKINLIICFLIMFLTPLFSQGGNDIKISNGSLNLGLKIHVPYLFQNNMFFEVYSYDISSNLTYKNSIETGTEFVGIYLTLGFDITNNVTIEAFGGIKGNKFPYASSGITNSFGNSIKFYLNSKKSFYGLGTLLVEKFIPSLPLDKPGISNSKIIDTGMKKFVGLGAGACIWNKLSVEISYFFPLGNKYIYEVTNYYTTPEVHKVTSIGSLNINLNYRWKI